MTHPDAAELANSLSEGLNALGFFICPVARAAAGPLDEPLRHGLRSLEAVIAFQGKLPLREAIERLLVQLRPLARGPWMPERTAQVAYLTLEFLRSMGWPVPVEGRCPLHGDACPTAA